MRRMFVLGAAVAMTLSALAAGAQAAPCRDSHGKFAKCPPPVVKHCRDIKTKRFVKCGSPHSEPVPTH
ncbi:MAG: hypothetical protein P4L73_01320 [Caulobacteraceae bacterium]|nr:hypothetical protein [Caulobacteraceae bacterium]